MATSPSPTHARPSPSFSGGRTDLPGTDTIAAKTDALSPTFDKERSAQRADEAARRESFMVKRDKPQPVLRPSPELALGADRAAFDARWEQERRNAAPLSQEERKAVFIERRQSQDAPDPAPRRAQSFNRQSRR